MGNFKEFHKFHRRHIAYLNEHGDSKIAVYTSAKVQNEIINLIAKQIVNTYLPFKFIQLYVTKQWIYQEKKC